MNIVYKKKGIRIKHNWFCDSIELSQNANKVDVLFFHQMLSEPEIKNVVCEEFHTLITDLKREEEEILSDINKTERYQIRKNTREDVKILYYDSVTLLKEEGILNQLEQIYKSMYAAKGIHQSINHEQMICYAKEGALVLSCAWLGDVPLVMHTYLRDNRQARLLHSVSEFRTNDIDANLIARANKRLHWEDIRLFRELGLCTYDWGGISSFENPNGIDIFKMKFGGKPVTHYNIILGNSLLGKIGIFLFKLKKEKHDA